METRRKGVPVNLQVFNLHKHLPIRRKEIKTLVENVCGEIDLILKNCSIIFCDDHTLRNMHETYLQNPAFTDVMTFNLGTKDIEGEIYVSIDRVRENAEHYNASFKEEIYRNIIHGLLHLKGYDDKRAVERRRMKKVENQLLRQASVAWLETK